MDHFSWGKPWFKTDRGNRQSLFYFRAQYGTLHSLVENSLLSFMLPDLPQDESDHESASPYPLPFWSLMEVDKAPLTFYGKETGGPGYAMNLFRFRWSYDESKIPPGFPTLIRSVVGYVIYGDYGFYILDFEQETIEQIRNSVYKYTKRYYKKDDADSDWKFFEEVFTRRPGEEFKIPEKDDPALGYCKGISNDWTYAFLWNHQVPRDDDDHDFYQYPWDAGISADTIKYDRQDNYDKFPFEPNDYRKGAIFSEKKFVTIFDLHGKKICGDLILENVEAPHINLSYCEIAGQLIIRNTTITGSLKNDEVSFNATGLKAKSVSLKNVKTVNGISFINARIDGYLQLKNVRDYTESQNHPTEGYSLNADGIKCGGKIHFLGGYYKGYVSVRNATIEGAVSLKSFKDDSGILKTLKIHDFSLKNSTITGGIRVRAVHIRERFDLSNVKAHGHIRFTPARWLAPNRESYVRTDIGGDLRLSGIDMPFGRLEARALRVGGSINIISAKMGPITLGLGRVMMSNQQYKPKHYAHRPDEIVCSAGRLVIVSSVIDGWLRAPMLQITGTIDRNDRRGFIVEESEIRGSLDLWLARAIRDNVRDMYAREAEATRGSESLSIVECPPYPSAWSYSAAVNGTLRVYNTQINAMLDLTLTQVDGPVDLRSSTVDGDVVFSSYASYYHEADTHPEDKEFLEKKMKNQPPDPDQRNACIRSLSLVGLQCKGDIGLSGLRLHARRETEEARTIDATRAKIKGEITLFSPAPEKNESNPIVFYAQHVKLLDLTDAEASRFLLSEDSFQRNAENSGTKTFLYLRRASFKIVQVYVSEYLRKKYGAPFSLIIWGANIENWGFFGKRSLPADWKRLRDFLDFQGEFPIRSSYSATEFFFRKKGYRDDADKILKEGEKKMIFRKWRNRADIVFGKWLRFKRFFTKDKK
jgi:hypothetical protein